MIRPDDARTIPEPRQVPGRQIGCPDCDRCWPTRQLARYELHWRITHDARPVEVQRG
jgi:hypothetical protein